MPYEKASFEKTQAVFDEHLGPAAAAVVDVASGEAADLRTFFEMLWSGREYGLLVLSMHSKPDVERGGGSPPETTFAVHQRYDGNDPFYLSLPEEVRRGVVRYRPVRWFGLVSNPYSHFGVTASAVRAALSAAALENVIVWAGGCKSATGYDMAEAFLHAGVAAYVGYGNYTTPTLDEALRTKFVDALLGRVMSAREALTTARFDADTYYQSLYSRRVDATMTQEDLRIYTRPGVEGALWPRIFEAEPMGGTRYFSTWSSSDYCELEFGACRGIEAIRSMELTVSESGAGNLSGWVAIYDYTPDPDRPGYYLDEPAVESPVSGFRTDAAFILQFLAGFGDGEFITSREYATWVGYHADGIGGYDVGFDGDWHTGEERRGRFEWR